MKIENIILQNHKDDSIQKKIILYNNEAFTYFDSGLTRHVFVNSDKTKVIKILVNKNSKDFNTEEIEIYKNAKGEIREQMAKTKIALNGYVIEQEFCSPIKFDDRELTIAQMLFASSCRNEVGWTKEGKLVCFDLDEFKRY